MTRKRNTPARVKSSQEKAERAELFKKVAVATLTTRQILPFKATANNSPVLSDLFVETVSVLTEGILEASKTFGDK